MRKALTVLVVLAVCRFAVAASHVVAPGGDDSAAGTEARPWKTLQKAAASVQPGDVVRIRAGDYFVGETWRVSRAGTAEKPITYQAFGDGEVRITSSAMLAVDAGATLADVRADVEGVRRPQGRASDMGAFEAARRTAD